MSRWLVIGAVVLALLLAALVFYPSGSAKPGHGPNAPAAEASEPALLTPPSQVDAVEITWTTKNGATEGVPETQRLVRGPLPDTWLREWTDANGVQRRWPAEGNRVRGGIRLLHETQVVADATPLNDQETEGRIVVHAGNQQEVIALSRTSLDGKRRATRLVSGAKARGFLLPDQVATLFDAAAIGEWLQRGTFPPSPEQPARITLTRGDNSISLGRVSSNWSLRSPLVSGVNRAKMSELILGLQTFTISRITESLVVPASPAMVTIQAEFDRPIVDGENVRRAAVRYTAEAWPGTSARSRELPARARVEQIDLTTGSVTPLWGPVEGVVSTEAIAAAMPELTDLLGRFTLTTAAADVTRVSLTLPQSGPVVWTRSGDRWSRDEVPLVGAELAAFKELLTLMSEAPADSVSLTDSPSGAACDIVVGDAPPVSLSLRLTDASGNPGSRVLVISTSRVQRSYDLGSHAALKAWLTRLLPA
ncbi:MAG: hypothetical protein SFY96_02775 [Planctomycetota bacterium]|nr:hypothetical protein [Planctomycetota bacterium]